MDQDQQRDPIEERYWATICPACDEHHRGRCPGAADGLIELDPNDFTYSYEEGNELDDAYPGDDTHCAVGRHCVGLRSSYGGREYPAIVATYLTEDFNTGYERGAWATCFYWESTGPVLDGKPTAICEDCAELFSFGSLDWYRQHGIRPGPLEEVDPSGEPMFEGEVGGVVWTVGVNDRDTFFAHLATYAPDHGMSWEKELGLHRTVLDALAAVGCWVREHEAELDRLEELLDKWEKEDEAREAEQG